MPINREMDIKYVVCVYVGVCACIYTHTHTNEILAIKKNEIMPFAATWMVVLEMFILNNESQNQLSCGIIYM